MLPRYVLALGAVGVAGCNVTEPAVTVKAPFDATEYPKYLATGSGRIVGQAFLRKQGGDVVTCAGAEVSLFPNTDYVKSEFEIIRAGGRPVSSTPLKAGSPEIAAWEHSIRKTTCDAQGNFVFAGLPDREWIVTTDVVWTVAEERQGGSVAATVQSKPGETKVLLTDSDLMRR